MPKDESDYNFLLGVANSIVMQFYTRMEAPKYRGSYLRYYGNVWGSIPLPRKSGLEESISEKVDEITEFIEDLEDADEILQNPAYIYEEFETDSLPLAEHPAIESFDLGNIEIGDAVVEDNNITFESLSAQITFFEEQGDYQDLLIRILEMKNFEIANEIQKVRLPTDESVLPEIIDRLEAVGGELKSASEDMRELQTELDDLVLELYDFSEEEKELIRERTETPNDPLDTRVVISS